MENEYTVNFGDDDEKSLFMKHVIGEDLHLLEIDKSLNDLFSKFDLTIESE